MDKKSSIILIGYGIIITIAPEAIGYILILLGTLCLIGVIRND